MKKNKKLLKGMTLVEVLVAMIIFFLMFTTIIGVLSVSLKFINQSRFRDLRTADQAVAVGKKVSGESDLQQVGSSSGYTVKFEDPMGLTPPRSSNTIDLFEALSGATRFGDEFNFQLKTFGQYGDFNGLTTPVTALKSNEYRIQITNMKSENVTLYVTISGTGDFIFEGNSDNGYIHTSKVYVKTIAANSGSAGTVIDFGYSQSSGNITEIRYVTASGTTGSIPVAFDGLTRELIYTIS
ncbi:MAG: type II secretion system protein J [Hominimerdicola sp.]